MIKKREASEQRGGWPEKEREHVMIDARTAL